MANRSMLSRRAFLATMTTGFGIALLAACSAPPSPSTPGSAPAGAAAPTSAPAAASGARKQVSFWGRQQFLPESNDYLTESVKLARQRGCFVVRLHLFTLEA